MDVPPFLTASSLNGWVGRGWWGAETRGWWQPLDPLSLATRREPSRSASPEHGVCFPTLTVSAPAPP